MGLKKYLKRVKQFFGYLFKSERYNQMDNEKYKSEMCKNLMESKMCFWQCDQCSWREGK